MSGKAVVVALIVCTALIMLPLAITSIVLGSTSPGTCDYEDKMGLDVAKYLLGLGISSVITCVVLISCYVMLLCDAPVAQIGIVIISILNALFGLAWFIVGAVILFRGNIDCIRNGSSHVIYALVLWCISALYFVKNCCSVKIHKDES